MIGRSGILLSKSYSDSEDEETFTISFKVDEEMAPEADVIVFYMRDQDGEIIHDKFRLEIPFVSSNGVRLRISIFLKILSVIFSIDDD